MTIDIKVYFTPIVTKTISNITIETTRILNIS